MNTGPAQRLCALLALAAAVAIFLGGIAWARENPLASYWDEAGYFQAAAIDYWALRDDRPLPARVYALARNGVGQPPAHRAVLALTYFTGVRPGLLRLISLAGLMGALGLIFLAGRRLGGATAGALAVLFILASPSVIAASIRYGSEFPLYIAEAALLYFLFAAFRAPAGERRRNYIGIGLALGLGFWTKPSFLTLAVPLLVLAYALTYVRTLTGLSRGGLIKAILLGSAVGAIYWIPFFTATLRYLERSVNEGRQSLGPTSFATLGKYCLVLLTSATGPLAGVLGGLLIAATLALWFARREQLLANPLALAGAGLCLAGSVLLPASQFFTSNHDPRYASAAIIPLALGLGLLCARILFVRRPLLNVAVALVCCVQIGLMFLPMLDQTPRERFETFAREPVPGTLGSGLATAFAPQEQWDWTALRALCDSTLQDPQLAYFGMGDPFNEKQIAYVWLREDRDVHPVLLWRYEEGAVEWKRIMHVVDGSDIAFTAPGYQGRVSDRQPLDNVHNAEFLSRLERDPHFVRATDLTLGRFDRTVLPVFINKRIAAHCTLR